MLSLLIAVGALVTLPVVSLPEHSPQAAQAAVAAGDVIYHRGGSSDSGVYRYKASDESTVQPWLHPTTLVRR